MIRIFDIPFHSMSSEVKKFALSSETDYTLFHFGSNDIRWVDRGLERMLQVARYTGAVLCYSDRFSDSGTSIEPHPVIDWQEGSLRDDFDFGSVILVRTDALRKAVSGNWEQYRYAGMYQLILALSRLGEFVHINEFLYYDLLLDTRTSGEKQFDYVNPRNREVQIEMEAACTAHLKAVGAWLPPVEKMVGFGFSEGQFSCEASVIIPCRNRAATIGDAIRSALSQVADFPYNVIVVDDNSTDGTVDVIKSFDDPRLVYIAQDDSFHAIGGNWNAAIFDPRCGRFALQLDSDDMYSGPDTVRRFVEAFYAQRCAMVIGSYEITDFDLNPLPPGLVDHREWTQENGHNNALRINGLGAPRGFFVPVLREIGFPVTAYGEDYAVALRISREYRIGRIYDSLYCCRRWGGNSDAALSVDKVNANNLYKDRLRTWEIQARRQMMLSGDSYSGL